MLYLQQTDAPDYFHRRFLGKTIDILQKIDQTNWATGTMISKKLQDSFTSKKYNFWLQDK